MATTQQQMLQIFEGLPLERPLCMYCTSQNLPEPQRASVKLAIAYCGPHVIVEVCPRCAHSLRGLGAVSALGRPATREELLEFYTHNGLQVTDSQVSGEERHEEEEEPAERPREALARAIEPPANTAPLRTPPAPREALWEEAKDGEKKGSELPWDGKFRCVTPPCSPDSPGRAFTSLNEHRKRDHADVPTTSALELLPRFKFACQSPSHREWGCKRTFPTIADRASHQEGRGPDRKIINAWKQGDDVRATT